jgi:hypothetical protein
VLGELRDDRRHDEDPEISSSAPSTDMSSTAMSSTPMPPPRWPTPSTRPKPVVRARVGKDSEVSAYAGEERHGHALDQEPEHDPLHRRRP